MAKFSYQQEPVVTGHPDAATARVIALALEEWGTRRRSMGCVSGAEWFCKRVPDFHPVRLGRLENDVEWEHVIATNGEVTVDLTPHWDIPDPDETVCVDGKYFLKPVVSTQD